MALPLMPIAATLAKFGAAGLAGFALARLARTGRHNHALEEALDALPEGANLTHTPGQINTAGRWRRTYRLIPELDARQPGVEIEAAWALRLKLRRVS